MQDLVDLGIMIGTLVTALCTLVVARRTSDVARAASSSAAAALDQVKAITDSSRQNSQSFDSTTKRFVQIQMLTHFQNRYDYLKHVRLGELATRSRVVKARIARLETEAKNAATEDERSGHRRTIADEKEACESMANEYYLAYWHLQSEQFQAFLNHDVSDSAYRFWLIERALDFTDERWPVTSVSFTEGWDHARKYLPTDGFENVVKIVAKDVRHSCLNDAMEAFKEAVRIRNTRSAGAGQVTHPIP